ncbi:MAG: hypothetical protein WAW11_03930 [Patescibacteria group bacterium]
MFLPTSLERIISLGGGIDIDASTFMPYSLERFAALASSSGATIILRNCSSLLPSSMERIASLGRGRVIFKL